MPPLTSGIIIDGCARVQFLPNTARDLVMLRVVELRNVGYVRISERALAWSPFRTESENNPGLRIIVHNSTVNEIASYAVQGRVDHILISNSKLYDVKPFSFGSLTGVTNIELTDNEFHNIEIQAFKKFTTSNFLLKGGVINSLPSRFLSDMEVTNLFHMEGVTVKSIASLAFFVSLPQRVVIESNIIGTLEGDAFRMVTRGPIKFRNNTVTTIRKGAFSGFSLHPGVGSVKGTQELLIDNNTVTELEPSSLTYDSSLTLRVDGLNLNTSCTCELAEQWQEILKEQGGTLSCWYILEGYHVSLPTFVASRCGAFKQTFWIFVVIGIVFVLLTAAIAIFYIVRRDNERKKKVQIVMPDGKTYRETEFHIVVERAELLTTDL